MSKISLTSLSDVINFTCSSTDSSATTSEPGAAISPILAANSARLSFADVPFVALADTVAIPNLFLTGVERMPFFAAVSIITKMVVIVSASLFFLTRVLNVSAFFQLLPKSPKR